jgi:hypothetical protein
MSEIPDSVSVETLKSLIGNQQPLPGASQFPAIDFGGKLGGPADLQYALCLLIQRSTDGVSVTQVLFAALQLLSVAQAHFESIIDRLDPADPDIADISAKDMALIKRTMESQAADMRDAMRAVSAVASLLGPALTDQRGKRIAAAMSNGTFMHRSEFFSRLLISDEFIESLGIERAAISDFVNKQIQHE